MAVDDGYTKSLLHFDGADGSTTFTDESGKAWSVAGTTAQLDTAQVKFGQSSGLFNGTSDCISTADHADFTVGSDDWTVECWCRLAADAATYRTLYSQKGAANSDTGIWLRLYSGTKVPDVQVSTAAATYRAYSATAITDTTTWHHVAAVKYGSELAIYLDGVKGATTAAITDPILDRGETIYIGCETGAAYYWNGWIDEFRFSKGVARYTANFTPPSGPFVLSGGEVSYFADGYSLY
jgi:hypothetical protein